jgi:hypothetical protein
MPPSRPSRSVSFLTIAQNLILPLLATGLVLAFTPARASMPVSVDVPKTHMATVYRPVATSEFAPFAQREWVNPKQPGPAIAEVRGLNLALMGVAPTNPFTQTQWTNPAKPKAQPVPSSFRPVFTSEFQPFNQTVWPNPVAPPPPFSEVRGFDLSRFLVSDPPFKQLTWTVPPKPLVPAPPSIYRPQADQAAADRPFVQTNWPNPIPPPRVRLPQPEQYFEAVYKPVMQNDWPLPWFPPPFKHDVIGPNLVVLHDMTNVPHPFVQLNWPLPAPIIVVPAPVSGINLPLYTFTGAVQLQHRTIRGNLSNGRDDWTVSYQG